MTTKAIQDGERKPYTCTGALSVNTLVKTAGGLFGVATKAGVTGDVVHLAAAGVYQLTKKAAASTAITDGGPVYGILTGGVYKLTGLLTGSAGIVGTGWEAAVTGATTAKVKLLGHNDQI